MTSQPSVTPGPEKLPQRKRGGQLSSIQIMFAAILAIALILAINFSSRIAATQPLQQTYDEVRAEIDRLSAEQASLIQERDYVRSDAYVEAWARDEGKMVRPGEVLVIPVPSAVDVDTTPPDTAFVEVETSPPQSDPWVVWWELFFDTPPPDL
ncbi:MAG: septum formation initiator family protein [Anaerolineae bacterium]|nr:septum formation initiator family protein [Anaerolineae bacterium]